MSQITINKSQKPDINLLVESDAKNPLSIKDSENSSLHDVAGLSWIFLDGPVWDDGFA